MSDAARGESGNGSSGAPLFCGVDLGASATKVLLLDESGTVKARVVKPSGVDYEDTARRCLDECLSELDADASRLAGCVATGYGRRNVSFADRSLTEIQCHGTGCYHLVPRAITIIDIGGQDNKIIRLDGDGRRAEFKMNRKCAAGTGAFIEEIALRLGLKVEEMDPLARSVDESVDLGSFCTVFAKTEILAHLRRGVPVGEIVRGAFLSVVKRIVEMDLLAGEVLLTGGVVAHNPSIGEIMEQKLGRPVTVPPHPQFTGALGAALAARKNSHKG